MDAGQAFEKTMPWFSLLGMDGSGKSSVLEGLRAEFDAPRTLGMKLYQRRPDLLFKPRGPKDALPHSRPPHSPARSIAKLGVLAIDCLWGYYKIVARERRDGYLVIFDRYLPHDILADPLRYRYGGPAWLLWRFQQFLPQPTASILLDAPVDVIWARKQEVPLDECRRQRQAYLQLLAHVPRIYKVDAARPLPEVVAEVARIFNRFLPVYV